MRALPKGLKLGWLAEAGNCPPLCGTPAGPHKLQPALSRAG
jgi:hypothetical protein